MPAEKRAASTAQERLDTLRELIREGEPSTQEELSDALKRKGYDVTQSTVSRDLRRIGAVKTTNADGEIIYVLPEEHQYLRPKVEMPINDLVDEIECNESLIVVHTVPGAANLVARHIDSIQETLGVIATIAGDDTILVVPKSVKKIANVVKTLEEELY